MLRSLVAQSFLTLAIFQGGTGETSADVRSALVGLAGVLVLSQVLAWHYVKFSPVLSNKRKVARTFAFVAATTMLVITVVKTSLALSLGLVGALSIIRFRTPIKEPEELAYLFLAIGIGLGFGAQGSTDSPTYTLLKDLRLITTLVVAGILVYMALTSLRGTRGLPPRMLLHVSAELGTGSAEDALKSLVGRVEQRAGGVDLRRVDSEGTTLEATLVLELDDAGLVGALVSDVQAALPGASVSLVEGGGLD